MEKSIRVKVLAWSKIEAAHRVESVDNDYPVPRYIDLHHSGCLPEDHPFFDDDGENALNGAIVAVNNDLRFTGSALATADRVEIIQESSNFKRINNKD